MTEKKRKLDSPKALVKQPNKTKRFWINDYSKGKIKEILPIFSVLIFLTAWINLCRMHNNLHLNEAIVCSSIIVSVLFFAATDQNDKLQDE
ncbi:MAG: hypothetical protein AAGJ18_25290 [Bacteroidota bacterium]